MTTTSSPVYRWRVGEIEITRVLEFEAALFEPRALYPEASPDIIDRHRAWLEPRLIDPASSLLVFAFHSTVIKTPRATILVDTGVSVAAATAASAAERAGKSRVWRFADPRRADLRP